MSKLAFMLNGASDPHGFSLRENQKCGTHHPLRTGVVLGAGQPRAVSRLFWSPQWPWGMYLWNFHGRGENWMVRVGWFGAFWVVFLKKPALNPKIDSLTLPRGFGRSASTKIDYSMMIFRVYDLFDWRARVRAMHERHQWYHGLYYPVTIQSLTCRIQSKLQRREFVSWVWTPKLHLFFSARSWVEWTPNILRVIYPWYIYPLHVQYVSVYIYPLHIPSIFLIKTSSRGFPEPRWVWGHTLRTAWWIG